MIFRSSASLLLATIAGLLLLANTASESAVRPDPVSPTRNALQRNSSIIGRWDITVTLNGGNKVPSWLEVTQSGRSLVGRFCGAFGSARPVSHVKLEGGGFRFSIPTQFEDGDSDIQVSGRVEGDKLTGAIKGPFFGDATFVGKRAPSLERAIAPVWGKPVSLFNSKDLTGWRPRYSSARNGWVVKNGILHNEKPGNDLVTVKKFNDVKILAEYRYPKGSNSGIYLRGRYEVQIQDDFGQVAESHNSGGVYGILTPRTNAAKKANEWQTIEITLVGRRVSIKLNGELIQDRQEIPGITGGALDSDEEAAGALFIQGDHGPIEFRKFVVIEPR